MIEILGLSKGKEYEAALHLRNQILTAWPDIAQNKNDYIKIFVGLKLYGFPIEDIDLVVIGHLSEAREFSVEYNFHPHNGSNFTPRKARIENFIFIIETKSHDATGVKFVDKTASVRYIRNGEEIWEDVTEKNRDQMFCFKEYLRRHDIDNVYLQDLIFFSGLREENLPSRPHNCFGADASFERLLNILGQISSPHRAGNNAYISFGSREFFAKLISPQLPFLQTMHPTPIDRTRMDRIVKAALPNDWLKDVGNKQVILRGRGGVGKTVMLLQMAYRSYDQEGHRSLILTYNKALVADMRRTMALLGIPKNIESGGISIETVHSFIGNLMLSLEIIEDYKDFLQFYEDNKNVLLEYIDSNTISPDDLNALIRNKSEKFLWDNVFVDEAQDWPSNEINILRSLYGAHKIIVADGVDQYVRNSIANWGVGVAKDSSKTRKLNRCLRMKANLANFVCDFANALELKEWDLEPNLEANGGRVFIIEGDLSSHADIYDRLASEAFELGNYPVDMLACIPPSLVHNDGHETYSKPGVTIIKNGGKIWDACSTDVRENYPTDRDALRIVQYDSCRGLEGWTVINYNYDDFWEYKFSQGKSLPTPDFSNLDEHAKYYAALWSMIPLTRAMDTLVINISYRPSLIRSALEKISQERSDFVEWIKL